MNSNRIEAEHVAFEEAVKLLREYRDRYKAMRIAVICESVAIVVLLAVNVWITTCLGS